MIDEPLHKQSNPVKKTGFNTQSPNKNNLLVKNENILWILGGMGYAGAKEFQEKIKQKIKQKNLDTKKLAMLIANEDYYGTATHEKGIAGISAFYGPLKEYIKQNKDINFKNIAQAKKAILEEKKLDDPSDRIARATIRLLANQDNILYEEALAKLAYKIINKKAKKIPIYVPCNSFFSDIVQIDIKNKIEKLIKDKLDKNQNGIKFELSDYLEFINIAEVTANHISKHLNNTNKDVYILCTDATKNDKIYDKQLQDRTIIYPEGITDLVMKIKEKITKIENRTLQQTEYILRKDLAPAIQAFNNNTEAKIEDFLKEEIDKFKEICKSMHNNKQNTNKETDIILACTELKKEWLKDLDKDIKIYDSTEIYAQHAVDNEIINKINKQQDCSMNEKPNFTFARNSTKAIQPEHQEKKTVLAFGSKQNSDRSSWVYKTGWGVYNNKAGPDTIDK